MVAAAASLDDVRAAPCLGAGRWGCRRPVAAWAVAPRNLMVI